MSPTPRPVIVDELGALAIVLEGPKRTGWKLELAALTGEENRLFERNIKKYHGACGCPHGAVAMFLSGLGYAAFLFLGDPYRPERIVTRIVGGLSVIVVGLVIGKALGLFLARRNVRRTLRELGEKINTSGRDPARPLDVTA